MPAAKRVLRPVWTLLAVLALGAAAASAQAAAPPPAIGLADNKASMYGDVRFRELGVRHVRRSIPWDVLRDPTATAMLDAWMAGARATRARTLLTFDRSPRRPRYSPTPAELAGALRALRARYGSGLREFSTWNEPNLNKQPRLVARWWLALRAACPRCTVLAGELLDAGNAPSYARRVARAAGREPQHWGLHNYLDVNRFTTDGTRAFLRSTQGQVWLTETGGVQARRRPLFRYSGTGPLHAANATRFLFERVVGLSPRIRRAYVYHWDIPAGPASWDSALVGPEGERPALQVLRQAVTGRIVPQRPRRPVPSYRSR